MSENRRSRIDLGERVDHGRSSIFCRTQTFTQERFALNLSIPNLVQLTKTFKECGLLGRSLKACCLSPLNNFDYSELSLKSYSKKLVQHLTNLHLGPAAHFRVEFATVEGLAQTPHDSAAVRITVLYKVRGRERVFYRGLLLSWNCAQPAPYAGCVPLSLALCHGSRTAVELVHAMLARSFDCAAGGLAVDHKDLVCLYVALAHGSRPAGGRRQWLELHYQLPGPAAGDEAVLLLPVQQQQELWHSLVNAERSRVDMREVEAYYKCMMKHVLETYGMDVGSLRLVKVRLPSATVSADGRVRASTPEALVAVLNLLSDLSSRLESARSAMSPPDRS
ncbi:uncharacterized protein LOC134540244 [Bacillus rossius redtenbacheri]|uniref:uncharacterized protein LOC134540244 n=1 Tax=Bacillus rossius redtenbacheri TaxID=93214 RepID=UPI002FDD3E17